MFTKAIGAIRSGRSISSRIEAIVLDKYGLPESWSVPAWIPVDLARDAYNDYIIEGLTGAAPVLTAEQMEAKLLAEFAEYRPKDLTPAAAETSIATLEALAGEEHREEQMDAILEAKAVTAANTSVPSAYVQPYIQPASDNKKWLFIGLGAAALVGAAVAFKKKGQFASARR